MPCEEDAGSLATNLLETKILINSPISDADNGARFILANIKGYSLTTLIENLEYIRVKYYHIPQDIWDRYNLNEKLAANDYMLIKSIPGLN